MTRTRRDLLATLLALLALALVEASGADMAIARLMAGPAGFIGRDSLLLAQAHDAGRVLAWAMLGALVLAVLRARWQARQIPQLPPFLHGASSPSWQRQALWLGVVLATAVLVPGIKRISRTSCPWDLAPFGGSVPYVPHWLLTVADGGPGHCFPSGHAAGVLAFIGLYFLWREHRPGLARGLAAGVWLLGAGYGAVQMLRGAHFLTHVLWAAWACWTIAAATAALLAWRDARHGRTGTPGPQAPNRSPADKSGRTGGTSPKWRQAAAVATRPRGVR